jgi:hypothetical protein
MRMHCLPSQGVTARNFLSSDGRKALLAHTHWAGREWHGKPKIQSNPKVVKWTRFRRATGDKTGNSRFQGFPEHAEPGS